jgi:hypothetical protein
MASHFKGLAYGLAVLIGAQQHLLAYRSKPLNTVDRAEAERALEQIRRTAIPGIKYDNKPWVQTQLQELT